MGTTAPLRSRLGKNCAFPTDSVRFRAATVKGAVPQSRIKEQLCVT
jgi:hypothetical protein